MHRFSEVPKMMPTASLYDSETVRQVLARASEIETQSEADLLNAAQIEALGGELGLSPDAVRRALGEKTGLASDTQTTQQAHRRRTLAPLTQEQIKAAYLTALWYTLLFFPILFAVSMGMRGGTIPNPVGSALNIIIAVVGPMFLAFRTGYQIRRAGVGAVSGILTTLLISAVSLAAIMMSAEESNLTMPGGAILSLLLISALFGASGAWSRRWWDSLPRSTNR